MDYAPDEISVDRRRGTVDITWTMDLVEAIYCQSCMSISLPADWKERALYECDEHGYYTIGSFDNDLCPECDNHGELGGNGTRISDMSCPECGEGEDHFEVDAIEYHDELFDVDSGLMGVFD